MATPTASPNVSSTVGLKNVVIAPLTSGAMTTFLRPTVEETFGEAVGVAMEIPPCYRLFSSLRSSLRIMS